MSEIELHTGISDIRLYTDGTSIYVKVKARGIWYVMIQESLLSSSIDACVTTHGIRVMQSEARGRDIAQRRRQDAKDRWKIRRAKQEREEKET